MPPRLAIDNHVDIGNADREAFCQRYHITSFGVRGSYRCNFIGSKFRSSNSFTASHNMWHRLAVMSFSMSMPPLVNFVPIVIRIGAKPQMRGIDAFSIVATMKNEQTIRDVTLKNLPRKTVSQFANSFRHSKMSVTIHHAISSPFPTSALAFLFRFGDWAITVDFLHESHFWFSWLHKQKPTPPSKSVVGRSESRNCPTGWKWFLSSLLFKLNKAIANMIPTFQIAR